MAGAFVRRWLPAAAALLAGMAAGLFVSFGTLRPQPHVGPIHHEDPSVAAIETDPAALFVWYATSLSHFRGRRFPEGRRLIVRLRDAHMAPDIQALAGEVDILLIKEGSILEAADAWLREGAGLLATGRIGAAEPLLAQIDRYARRGAVLADDLVEGVQALGRQSRVAMLPEGAPERRAYDEVLRALPEIKTLLEQYRAGAAEARSLAAALAAALPGPPGPSGLPGGLPGVVGILPESLAGQIAYPTRITLTAVSPAYPGRTFAVSGAVTEEGPAPSLRPLILRLDDVVLATLPLGPFSRDVLLPPGTPPGMHALSAVAPAQGPYLGAVAQAPIRVTQAPPFVWVQVPGRALAPGGLKVSGRTSSRFGPLAGAGVEVRIGPVVASARTSVGGEFALTVRLPGALDLVGTQIVTVRVVPREPWNAAAESRRRVFVINLINVALAGAVALVVPAAGLAYRRNRRQGRPHLQPLPVASITPPIVWEPSVAVIRPETPRDEITAIYREAASALQRLTGLEPTPAMTLREYARLCRPLLRTDAFSQLTTLVEMVLYSLRPVTVDQPPQARDLNARVEGEVMRAVG